MIRRKTGLPKYCSLVIDRHGKRRVRFRKAGFSTYLTDTPLSEEFMRQYYAALDGVKLRRRTIGAARTRPGSFNALCVAYYRSPEFTGLRSSTQATYRGIVERFRAKHGDKLLRDLQRQHLKAIIGAMDQTPAAANNLLRILKMLLTHAVDLGMLKQNPAVGLKGFENRSSGFHTWTEEEIDQFKSTHALGTKARLAFELLLTTGQRRGDVVRMGWQHITNGWMKVLQQKTGTEVEIPVHPNLLEAIVALPRTNMTFLVTAYGAPHTPAGFGNWFREQCDTAGLKNCSAHGLRKSAARRLAEAGCSTEMIKAITGHKTLKEVARYTAAADQKHLAQQATEQLQRAEREQKLSNLDERLDKTEAK